MRRIVIVTAAAVLVTGALGTGTAEAGAVAGYQVELAGGSAPAHAQGTATATCPGTDLVTGGGVFSFGGLSLTIDSSYPSATNKWTATVNNNGASTASFAAYAVCVKRARLYSQSSNSFDIPADWETDLLGFCPGHTHVLGGGVAIHSTSVLVNVWEDRPASARDWVAGATNGTSADVPWTAYAVCGKRFRDQSTVLTNNVDNPPHTLTSVSASCPAGEVPLSGGGETGTSNPAINLGDTYPSPHGWVTDFVNNSSVSSTGATWVTCATPT